MTQLGDSWRTQKALLHLVAAGCPLQLTIQRLRQGPGQHRRKPHGPERQGVRSRTSPGSRSGDAWGLGLTGELKRASGLSAPLLGNAIGHSPNAERGHLVPSLSPLLAVWPRASPSAFLGLYVCICRMKPRARPAKCVRTARSVPGVGRPDEDGTPAAGALSEGKQPKSASGHTGVSITRIMTMTSICENSSCARIALEIVCRLLTTERQVLSLYVGTRSLNEGS